MGTLINVVAVLIGGGFGLLFGSRLPERVRQTVVAGLGLFTTALGLRMFIQSEHAIVVLGSLLLGGLLGEWWRIEDGLRNLGFVLEQRFSGGVPNRVYRKIKAAILCAVFSPPRFYFVSGQWLYSARFKMA
jgi:uncharacterized membrane protein YqgA involved in biofilm formation